MVSRLTIRPRPFITSPHVIGLLIVTARLAQEQVAARLAPLGISYAQAVVLVRLYRSDTGSLAQSDMIESLTLAMNRVRQAKITREIIEIVSGAAAL